jgi:hypothetical protein
LLAANCLGSFPKLTLARTLLALYARDPAVAARSAFAALVATAKAAVRKAPAATSATGTSAA